MKIGLISDLHANLPALEAVLQHLRSDTVELVLCAGDLLCYGAYPNETLDLLRAEGIACVAGNYDYAVAWNLEQASKKESSPATEPVKRAALEWTKSQIASRHIHYLRGLPWSMRLKVDHLFIRVLHASDHALDKSVNAKDLQALNDLENQYSEDVVVFGHTHTAFEYRGNSTQLINPGSVGRSLDGDPGAQFAVLDTQTRLVRFYRIEYPIDQAVSAIRASGMPFVISDLVERGVARVEELTK